MSRRSLAVGAHTQSQSHPGTYMRGPTRWSPARPRLVCTFTPPSPHSLPPLRGRLRVLSVPLCAPTSCRVGVFPSLPFTSPRTVSPSSPGVRRRGLCTGDAHVKFAIRIRTCIDLVAHSDASASLATRRVAHDAAHAIISRLIPTGHPSLTHSMSCRASEYVIVVARCDVGLSTCSTISLSPPITSRSRRCYHPRHRSLHRPPSQVQRPVLFVTALHSTLNPSMSVNWPFLEASAEPGRHRRRSSFTWFQPLYQPSR